MTRNVWHALGPGLLVGAGIVAATGVASLAANSGWWAMAGPLLLTLAIIGADVLDSRLKGKGSVPSPAALVLGSAILLAGLIVDLRDPRQVETLIPIIGAGTWVALLRPDGRRKSCGTFD